MTASTATPRCVRCGRRLRSAQAIAAGIGPECISKVRPGLIVSKSGKPLFEKQGDTWLNISTGTPIPTDYLEKYFPRALAAQKAVQV